MITSLAVARMIRSHFLKFVEMGNVKYTDLAVHGLATKGKGRRNCEQLPYPLLYGQADVEVSASSALTNLFVVIFREGTFVSSARSQQGTVAMQFNTASVANTHMICDISDQNFASTTPF